MRILVLDIETKPGLSYYWSTFKTTLNPEMLLSEPSVLCFAAKWLGEDKVMFFAEWDEGGRAGMIDAAYRLLDDADAVVHYNGESFDATHLNREFFLEGRFPPAPYKHIDLLRTMQRRFNFASNRLAHIGPVAVGTHKESTGGIQTWIGCMNGDAKARRRMKKYNIQDVVVTEKLYVRALPWIRNHPNRQLYDGHQGCPACGSEHFQRRGFAYTGQSKFVKLQCQDCGKYWRRTERVSGVKSMEVTGG